jgi:soluble cytochrome b562
VSDEQQTQQADDPSGPGWRDVEPDELLQDGDMLKNNTGLWFRTRVPGMLAREGGGGTYRRRIEPQQPSDSVSEMPIEQVRTELQARGIDTTAATARVLAAVHAAKPPEENPDDPRNDRYWRDILPDERIKHGDVHWCGGPEWENSDAIGLTPRDFPTSQYRRRIEPPLSDSERYQMLKIETLSDMVQQLIADRDEHKRKAASMQGLQERLNAALKSNDGLEHDIQRQYELLRAANERNEKLVRQVELTQQENGELQGLVSQAKRSGQQVNAELQQLREQVQTLTTERDRLQSWLQQHHTTGQQSAIKKLERWLKPVLKVVSDHPDHTSILAASVLEFLPQIASRLIEE